MSEYRFKDGSITIPYKWTTGKALGPFLTAFRDNRSITGSRSKTSGKVFVPPLEYDPETLAEMELGVPISDEGVITTFTIVKERLQMSPWEPPYAIAAIRLDGADTDLLHRVALPANGDLKTGTRVQAVWAEERTGDLMDIQYFVLATESNQ